MMHPEGDNIVSMIENGMGLAKAYPSSPSAAHRLK